MRNTHSIAVIGEGFSYFADGIPNDHECNSKGDWIYITASGKVIHWYTFRKWASYTSQYRNRLIEEYQDRIGDPILQGSVTCSICKEAAINQINDWIWNDYGK